MPADGTYGVAPEELEKLDAERKDALKKLASAQNMLQMLMDNIPQYIYWKNANHQYMGCNKLYAESIGFENPEDILGKTDEELGVPRSKKKYYEELSDNVMKSGIPEFHHIIENESTEGKVWLDMNQVPLFQGQKVIGLLGTFEDITARITAERELQEHRDHLSEMVGKQMSELNKANEELKAAYKRLESSSMAKSQFVANVSHELRTPLNAVVAMTEMMMDSEITAVQREYLSTILESADSLLFTINDLLDYSKIEAGKLQFEQQEFNFRESLESTLKLLSVKAFEKKLELIVDIDRNIPKFLVGDPLRMRQIIVNLLGNAIKFTDEGEVALVVKLARKGIGGIELNFEIQDTGIGIPEDRISAIFSAFEQAHNSTTRHYGGSGLGLSIVSQLVHMMGGEISATSTLGEGSCFKFNLLLGYKDHTPRKGFSKDLLKSKAALVIDDNETMRFVISEMLEGFGMEVAITQELTEACGYLEQVDELPEIIIVDSPFDGGSCELLSRITDIRKKYDKQIRILLMLSGGNLMEKMQEIEGIPHMGSIFKPLFDFDLRLKLESLFLEDATSTTTIMRPHRLLDDGELSLKVLLVDDREINLKVGRSLLDKLGHEVTFARDGNEAVQMVQSHEIDVILMDIQMPVMDGYEATRHIRNIKKEHGIYIPVIALTAQSSADEEEKAVKAGMDGFLSKPIRRDELKRAMDGIIERLKRR